MPNFKFIRTPQNLRDKMPTSRKIFGCVIWLAVIFMVTGLAGYVCLRYVNYHSALDATRTWARVNEFPASATSIEVETSGGMFTREFVVTFVAPIDEIDVWLNESPGTSGVTPTINGTIRTYKIEAGGGAQFAEIQVDEQEQSVRIHTYWS